jgi:tetratricopeptide (TPR) repeat protein
VPGSDDGGAYADPVDFLERLAGALSGPPGSLETLWDSLAENERAEQLIVAHYLADAQANLDSEVRWDELALLLADRVTDKDLQALHPTLTLDGYVPSLQLNLADGYRRLGRFEEAAEALSRSVAYNDRLLRGSPEQDAYRELIIHAQQRVRELIEAGDTSEPQSARR